MANNLSAGRQCHVGGIYVHFDKERNKKKSNLLEVRKVYNLSTIGSRPTTPLLSLDQLLLHYTPININRPALSLTF